MEKAAQGTLLAGKLDWKEGRFQESRDSRPSPRSALQSHYGSRHRHEEPRRENLTRTCPDIVFLLFVVLGLTPISEMTSGWEDSDIGSKGVASACLVLDRMTSHVQISDYPSKGFRRCLSFPHFRCLHRRKRAPAAGHLKAMRDTYAVS